MVSDDVGVVGQVLFACIPCGRCTVRGSYAVIGAFWVEFADS